MTPATPKPRAGEHTKGPWRTQDALVSFPDSAGGFSLQNCPAPEANARRIVACVNCLEDISTAEIERMTEAGHFATVASVEAERDLLRERERELVEALQRIDQAHNGPWDGQEQRRYTEQSLEGARALLAKHGR